MKRLNNLVILVSQSAWLFVMAAVFAFGSLGIVFFNINDVFEVMVGAQMFDFQNDLTVAMIYEQLPNYSYAARKLYFAFIFVDFFFPFFAGLVLAASATFALRHLSTKWYDSLDGRNLFALFFIPTLFDWCENIFALIVVNGYPDELTVAATMLVIAKKGKPASVMLMQAGTWILLLMAALKWAGSKAGFIKARQ
jgi:hypothetical protein